jgi:hypothetical protein
VALRTLVRFVVPVVDKERKNNQREIERERERERERWRGRERRLQSALVSEQKVVANAAR